MREIFQSNAIDQTVSPDARLTAYLAQTEMLLRSLSDPDYPDIGHEFMERLNAARCTEEARIANMYKDVPAVYASFDPTEERSFINLIKYNMGDDGYGPPSATAILRSRLHEGDHAMAWNSAAILHATPFNRATQVIMCPESFLIASDLVERNAYAKQAWLGSLIGACYPKFHDLTVRDPISSRKFAHIRAQHDGALLPTMIDASEVAMTKRHHLAPTYAAHYHGCALSAYEAQMDYLIQNGRKFVFVRIGAQDIEDIGRTYGPNIFRDQPLFLRTPQLSAIHAQTLERLHAKYGTGPHVPDFGSIVNRAAFLETSKNQGLARFDVTAPQLVAA